VPGTGGWGKPQTISVGQLRFDQPGVYHLVLAAAAPDAWRAVNIWQLWLAPKP
jgi:hypothetical protein